MLACFGICRCMYICSTTAFSPHNTRPTKIHLAIDLPAPAHAVSLAAHDRRFAPACLERALVDAITTLCSPQFAPSAARGCCTTAVSLQLFNETAQRERSTLGRSTVPPAPGLFTSKRCSLFLSLHSQNSSGIFFARPLSSSDFIEVTLGPQWVHLRPPTAPLHTRGPPPPTTVHRSTPSSPTQTHTLPPNPDPRACSKRGAQMSIPRCWRAKGRQQPWQDRKKRATTSETSTMRTTTASRRAHGT
jgi:hypothetical protein